MKEVPLSQTTKDLIGEHFVRAIQSDKCRRLREVAVSFMSPALKDVHSALARLFPGGAIPDDLAGFKDEALPGVFGELGLAATQLGLVEVAAQSEVSSTSNSITH